MEATKTIKPGKKYIQTQYIFAGILLVMGILGLIKGVFVMTLGIGILILVLALVQKEKGIIMIFEQNLEIKLTLLAATKFIKSSDLKRIEKVSPKKIIVYYQEGERERKFYLPVQMIESNDAEYLVEWIEAKLKAAA